MNPPVPMVAKNIDPSTVQGFGDEWRRFDQSDLSPEEHQWMFDQYFHIFPWQNLPARPVGFDLGCGSGRWARLVAPQVGELHCVDPAADALDVTKRVLAGQDNVRFHLASVDTLPFADSSMDFGYSLGVLHHIPDTSAALRSCVVKLKPGAPFLLYLYYAFDNRPWWFRHLWQATDLARRGIARTPEGVRQRITDLIALTVYLPAAKGAALAEALGANVENMPLSYYRSSSFYTLRTDARDRFGTRLEQRFTRSEIEKMMTSAGLTSLRFSEQAPFWCAVGYRER